MAWNEPGGGNQHDPWSGGGRRGNSGGDRGGRIEQVATKQPCEGGRVKSLPRALEPCTAVGRPGTTGGQVQAC